MIGKYSANDRFNHYGSNYYAAWNKRDFYRNVQKFTDSHSIISRFTGVGIGLSSSVISIRFRVSRLSEVVSRSAHDLKQGRVAPAAGRLVFKGTEALIRLALSPLDIAVKTAASTIGYLVVPQACANYSELKYHVHVGLLEKLHQL